MDTAQTHNQSIVAKWQVSQTVAKKRKPNSRISLNSPSSPSTRAQSPALATEQPVAGPSTLPAVPASVPENQVPAPAPRIKKSKTSAAINPEQLAAKYAPPNRKLNELGGLDEQIDQLLEVVGLPLRRPEMYHQMGTERPKGVLLHGVQGGGKTQLVNCLAGTFGLPFIKVSAPSIVSGMSGESEKTLRDTFDEAKKLAPCILFLDEVDAITPKRETAQREMERRIVAQLLTCFDGLSPMTYEELMVDLAESMVPVVVIGATNRPDSLDPALRRAGRFDHEIEMGVPSAEGREAILRVLCEKMTLSGDVDFRSLARATPGYVGADLTSLATTASTLAIRRCVEGLVRREVPNVNGESIEEQVSPIDHQLYADLPASIRDKPMARFLVSHPNSLNEEQLSTLSVSFIDFTAALKIVQPSAKREGFATVPETTWADIGALGSVREELHMAIVRPASHPELFSSMGMDSPSGVLLWGPPGCGKTLLAKAVANESRTNFISVKGPELLNKYVGESEKAVRQVFARARASAPCVIFFDELDALVPRRDESMSESSARVVNTLLTELDGLDNRKAVYVIGATNRPDMIDPAMVRPGRLDKLLYVDLPSPSERFEVLKTHTKRTPIDATSYDQIAEIVTSSACDGYSGADIAALVREASALALKGVFANLPSNDQGEEPMDIVESGPITVTVDNFREAAKKTRPSVSREQKAKYERLRDRYAGLPTKGRRLKEEGEVVAGTTKMEGGESQSLA